jgi:hypothetical protein
LPIFWPFPIFRRGFWEDARCLHPTSVYRPSKDYVTGHRDKPRQMHCNSARGYDREHCGPQARFWEARSYPPWVWTVASMGIGAILTAAYIAFLRWGIPPIAVRLFG